MIRWKHQYVRLLPVLAALVSLLVASGAGALELGTSPRLSRWPTSWPTSHA